MNCHFNLQKSVFVHTQMFAKTYLARVPLRMIISISRNLQLQVGTLCVRDL